MPRVSSLRPHTLRADPRSDAAPRRRRPHARFSLRWRLTFWFGLGFAATLLAMFITLHQLLINTLLHDVDDDVTTLAARIADQVADPQLLNDPVRLFTALRASGSLGIDTAPRLAAIRDAQGHVLWRSSTPGLEQLDPTRADLAAVRAGDTAVRTARINGGRPVRVATAPIRIDGNLAGTVQAGESLAGLFSAGDRLQLLLIVEGAAGLLLAGAAGYAFARRGLRPLDRVVGVAADIEGSDLTRRLNLQHQPIEVQALADTFDAMLERLEHSFEQQRRFVLDVSHELRTPLTALRGNLDVLLMDSALSPDVRAQLERMSAETGRLIRLAANLLYMGQADTGKVWAMAPVELDLLCLEIYQQTANLKPGVRLRLGDEDQVTVLGDRDLLKQMLLNLVENGLVYTPAGGSVTLSLTRNGAHGVIEVRDTGVGIAPDDLPHIFDRFYRAESTRRRAAGGAGVGLAIVEWVARLHGGTVTVESRPGQGSVFTVRLPLYAEQPPPADPALLSDVDRGADERAAVAP